LGNTDDEEGRAVRIATMVLSLILMLVVGAQSCAVSIGDSLGNAKASTQSGVIGLLIAFLFLVAGAFALSFPLVSGLFGLIAESTTSFSDLTIWGVVSLILAVFSFFGWREKRRRRREEAARVV
jgi:hypothetical protein